MTINWKVIQSRTHTLRLTHVFNCLHLFYCFILWNITHTRTVFAMRGQFKSIYHGMYEMGQQPMTKLINCSIKIWFCMVEVAKSLIHVIHTFFVLCLLVGLCLLGHGTLTRKWRNAFPCVSECMNRKIYGNKSIRWK